MKRRAILAIGAGLGGLLGNPALDSESEQIQGRKSAGLLAMQSPQVPQAIPQLAAELRTLIVPSLHGREGTSSYTVRQIVEIDNCRISITRADAKSGDFPYKSSAQTSFEFGQIDFMNALERERGGYGMAVILFVFPKKQPPDPVILYRYSDGTKPDSPAKQVRTIAIYFPTIAQMRRAELLIKTLRRRCA